MRVFLLTEYDTSLRERIKNNNALQHIKWADSNNNQMFIEPAYEAGIELNALSICDALFIHIPANPTNESVIYKALLYSGFAKARSIYTILVHHQGNTTPYINLLLGNVDASFTTLEDGIFALHSLYQLME